MHKHTRYLWLLLAILVLPLASSVVFAQETMEADVVADIVMPRLEEYGANLPDHYGTVSVDAFLELLSEDEDVVILDVREDGEIEEFGIIEGAVHVPLRTLGENLDLLPDLDATIVVVCKGGFRATIGMTALHVLGYENAKVLVGGFDAWVGEELPVVDEAAMVEASEMPEDIDPMLQEYVADYLANLPEGWGGVKPDALFEELFEEGPDSLIDVRSDEEWADPGYIEGATHIWVDDFMASQDMWPEELDSDVVVYCASGYRGGVTSVMLGLAGYENVRNLSGGIKGWVASDLPLVTE
jgi:rhodanese-related sulfurtransferase